jgi:Pyridine nucleotide-disulphide oxidoreductase
MTQSQEKHRVVIVGAGFAGFNAARQLSTLVGATTEIVVINPTDYFLYVPLMPRSRVGSSSPTTSASRCGDGGAASDSYLARSTTSMPAGRSWHGQPRRADPARPITTGSS